MGSSHQRGVRRGPIVVAAVTVVLVLGGAVLLLTGLSARGGPPQPVGSAVAAPRPSPAMAADEGAAATPAPRPSTAPAAPAPAPVDLGPIMAGSPPVRLEIPSIGVHTSRLVDLGRAADGTIEVPKDFAAAGFYAPGPTPGQFGPAVIAGHVDSHNGPAVFYRLGTLRAGAQIVVGREDGSTARFVVDKVQRYPKAKFPTSTVYGNSTDRAELRLITCGGSFDRTTGHYVDNVIAFAHLVSGS